MRLLDDQALSEIYDSRVRRVLFHRAVASADPRAVIVGGQPGAGKTGAVLGAARELRQAGQGVAFINGDELRAYHPHYPQLVKQDRSTAADKTGADVGLWVERGIREAAAGRYHAVIETTMRQPAVVARTADLFRSSGHHVEMRVVVVHPELSRLAIYQRFGKALESPGAVPRFTLPRYHEDALASMPESLKAITASVNLVRFVDRSGTPLYDSSASRVSPAAALLAERKDARLSQGDQQHVQGEWARLVGVLDRDGVPDLVRHGVRAEHARFASLVLDAERAQAPRESGKPDRGR